MHHRQMESKGQKTATGDKPAVLILYQNEKKQLPPPAGADKDRTQSSAALLNAPSKNNGKEPPAPSTSGYDRSTEANNNLDGDAMHAGADGGTGEDDGHEDVEAGLEKDYEKDYQTVLRLKQVENQSYSINFKVDDFT